jgi:hypothetical protein
VDNPTGRVSQQATLTCTVFPNPATSGVELTISSSSSERIEVQLARAIDNLLTMSETMSGQQYYNLNLDTRQLTPGLYFLIVKQGELLITERLMIMR